MGLSRAAHRWGVALPLPKICQKYPERWNLVQLYLILRRSKKYLNHVIHTFSFSDISIFSPEISKFCYINKHKYRLHFDTQFQILLTDFESLRILLIKMVATFEISAKMTTFILKYRYVVIIFVSDVIKKVLSRDSNYILDVTMWTSLVIVTLLWEKLS